MRHLSENIAKNGLLSPVVIASDGVLIDGHRRVLAAKKAGIKTLRAVVRNEITLDNLTTETTYIGKDDILSEESINVVKGHGDINHEN